MVREVACKLDRITVSGSLPKWSFQDIESFFEFDLDNTGAFQLVRDNDDGTTENMAWLGESQFKRDLWRLDFNPANLYQNEKDKILAVIQHMENAHFTRLDVAFDVFNDPFAMSNRVYKTNVTERQIETYRGRSKSVETIYWGARKSEQQIRLYDKLVEQTKRHKQIPEGITHWARLELQLRGKKPVEWVACAKEMLGSFKLSALQQISDPRERAIMHALDSGVIEWQDLSPNTRSKYRKMIKNNVGYSMELSDDLLTVLCKQQDSLENELKEYLKMFNV